MKKTLSIIISAVLVLTFLSTQTAFAFSDVPDTHKNSEAINFLQENGVIQGYKDGTFKPDNKVNRAEFLKIIIEGSDIPLNSSVQTGFSDVDESAWYAPYIRKAKKEGWIEGYGDGTFRPASEINKVEALKILGKVQNWDVKKKVPAAPFKDVAALAWYTPYVEYAKEHNFLEVQGAYFQPSILASRAKISEIIYRTIRSGEIVIAEEKEETPEEPIQAEKDMDFTPVLAQTKPATHFANIQLDTDFPTVFYKNEIYTFKGKILTGTFSQAFVFLSIPNGNGNTTNHIGNVENGEFAINVQFRETGNFNLGIIPGSQGTSKIVPISVVPSLPDPISKTNPANKATALSVSFSDNQTTFNWTNPSQITKLTVYQTNKSKTFFFRQERMAFTPEYKDFEGFGENKTYFKVDSATTSTTSLLEITSDWTTSSTSSFQATTHTFADVFDDQITYSTIPDISEKSQMIRFSGTTKIDIFREAAIITASGTVARVNMTSTSYGEYYGNDIIQNGNKYTFEYTPTEKGTYIIEINQTNGQAVINKPVFVGSVIPLVPDFFDLYETPPLQKGTINIEKSRNELLGLINETRRKMGLSEVTLSDELNTLAQSHTSDMIVNNFFAHINKNGESPNDRRIKMGITTEVGENLARTSSIKFAHEGLMRSAVHRENIIGEDWTRVGIGIYKDGEGYYVITEEFSTQPLQSKDIDTYEQEIVDAINGARTTHDMFIDPTLTGIAENWSITMANQDFLGFEAPNSEKLINKITEQNIQVQVQAFVVESLNLNSIKTKILEDTEVTNSNWNSMGLSMKIGKTGELKFTLLYTP